MSSLARLLSLFAAVSLLLWGSSALVAAEAGHLTPTELRCESFIEPLGLDEPAPRLTWILSSDRRNERQSAYRILVASSRERLDRDEGDLWDSGRVATSQMSHVPYAGTPLRSRQRCHWKVMSWDRDRNAGAWSAPSLFEMGLLAPSDWSAAWLDATPSVRPIEIVRAIYATVEGPAPAVEKDVTATVAAIVATGRPLAATNDALGGDPAKDRVKRLSIHYRCAGDDPNAPPRTLEVPENATAAFANSRIPLLRRSFTVERPVAQARVYVTALGLYELHLNGTRVGDHRLAPGWTDYRKRVQYQVFDVTESIRSGRNAIGAVVAPGWFAGRAGLFHISRFYGDTPALLVQLELTYADGAVERITTDDQWRRRDSGLVRADLMDGEEYDARETPAEWTSPAFDDTSWSPAAIRPSLASEARRRTAAVDPPVRVLREMPAIALTEPMPGHWIFDCGQNMVGVARLAVSAPAGTRITLRYGEMLNPDGTLYTANLRGAACTDTYIAAGSASGVAETWEPRFTVHGFRYVEVTGLPARPSLGTITGVVLGSDTTPTGTFVSSDPALNRLYENILWGQRGNYLSVPTDCPQRDERMGWMADTQVFAPTAAFNADVLPFLSKWMIDVDDAQREDGAHSDVAPVTRGLNYGTPAWADAGTIVPWTLYRMYGDTRILERHIESMRRWVDWCSAHSTNLLRDRDRGNDYGDWLAIGEETPKDLIGTAYFAHSADIVARAMRILGRDAEADRYASLFESIRAAFAAAYVDTEGRIKGNTQCGYALALRFDLLEKDLRPKALNHLVARIEANGWRLSTGFVGVGNLLPVLSEQGRSDLAYRLLLQDAFPSWLFSVRHGATTIWERWDGWTPERGPHPDISMNSFNHYSLGSCGEWLYTDVAGITPDPTAPGFARVIIRPQCVGPLTSAAATYRSVKGTIGSAWSVEGEQLSLRVTIPANTAATVYLPARGETTASESGMPLDRAEGVALVRRERDMIALSVGSGTYEFRSTLPERRSGNPILSGWYADPEVASFAGRTWIYPTYSAPYDQQTFFDAFSSTDLVRWTKHPRILDTKAITWAKRAMWAPSVIEKGGRYYLFFGANDIQNDQERGGIGVAVSDSPAGPFVDHLGKPLVDAFHNGAQPIDQFVFRDRDGRHYLIYGGWRHCNIARLADDFKSLVPFEDGTTFREITPEGYVEGPFLFLREGRYYFMWSEGGWTGPDYRVAYAIGDSPQGPFRRAGTILAQDPTIATGAGHHSVLHIPATATAAEAWYIVYHRRPLGETDGNHRVVCIDRLTFDANGAIEPVRMTVEGVAALEGQSPASR